MKMIVAEIIGGLGNQMFQYANAKALALTNDRELVLDLSRFEKYKLHNGYELNRVFGISDPVASKCVLKSIFGVCQLSDYISPKLRNCLARFLAGPQFLCEKSFGFEEIKLTTDVQYVSGYWQSAKYFESYTDGLRQDFTFQIPDNHQLNTFREAILSAGENAVSLHVRRGDYLAKKNASLFASLPKRYYVDAINLLKKNRKTPKFFVFSDDIDWCREKFVGDEFTFVTGFSGSNSYLDMYLMSLCNSNVIANSTFSWWGAWLNGNLEKIVVAPRAWFADKKINTMDIYPSDWKVL